MLERLKILLGIQDEEQDALLNVLIVKATDVVLNYTRRQELFPVLENIVVDIALIAYNRMGAEGEQSRGEGSVSRTFYELGEDLPKSILIQLDRHTLPPKARVVGV